MPKPTILYAEDNLESRENYALILRECFDKIYLASDGEEALMLYRQYKPDMLLLDIKMPKTSGIDVVKQIRENDDDTPIVMMTAYSDRETLLQAVELKLDAYLIKPVDIPKLLETLKNLIDKINSSKIVSLLYGLIWDEVDQKLFYKNSEIKLTKKERQLLHILASNAGSYHTHDELIINIWDDELPDHTYNKKLIQLIYRLNKKIAEMLPSQTYLIENSYKLGYRVLTNHDIQT